MTGQVPTEEVVQVCWQFMELAEDYLLLSRMNGVENIVDLFLDESQKDRRSEAAFQTAKDLLDQVKSIDALAKFAPEVLAGDWPDVLALLAAYSFHHVDVETGVVVGVHEWFQPLWVAAEALGLDVEVLKGAVEEEVAAGRRGRPVWSGRIASAEQFIEDAHKLCAPYFERGERPTEEALGRGLFPQQNIIGDDRGYYSRTVRRYMAKCSSDGYPFHDYASFLEYLKHR